MGRARRHLRRVGRPAVAGARDAPEPSVSTTAARGVETRHRWAAEGGPVRQHLPKVYAARRPDDFEDYRDRLVANLRRPGYAKAFSLTTRTDHAPAEARLADVSIRAKAELGDVLARAAVGRSRGDAIHAMSQAYRTWALLHPGRYAGGRRAGPARPRR